MRYVSVRDLAIIGSVSTATARRWVAAGLLPAWRAGSRGRVRVRLPDAARFLEMSEAELEAALSAAADGVRPDEVDLKRPPGEQAASLTVDNPCAKLDGEEEGDAAR